MISRGPSLEYLNVFRNDTIVNAGFQVVRSAVSWPVRNYQVGRTVFGMDSADSVRTPSYDGLRIMRNNNSEGPAPIELPYSRDAFCRLFR